MRLAFFGLLFASLGALGCTTTVSAAGDKVQYFSNDSFRVRGCQLIGRVEGRSFLGPGAAAGSGIINARNEMREKVSAMGGTDLNILSEDQAAWGTHSTGEAYLCPST